MSLDRIVLSEGTVMEVLARYVEEKYGRRPAKYLIEYQAERTIFSRPRGVLGSMQIEIFLSEETCQAAEDDPGQG